MQQVIQNVPKKYQRLHSRSRKALLAAEYVTLKELFRVVENDTHWMLLHISHTADEIAQGSVIRQATQKLQNNVDQVLIHAKATAREAAREQLQLEFDEVDISLPEIDQSGEDEASALATANSLAAAWATAMVAAILLNEDKRPTEDSVNAALTNIEPRIRRIATTEIARSYNDELNNGFDAVSQDEQAKELSVFPILAKRWDATLDRKTCPTCREHDGEYALLGFDFDGGDVPGYVHPNCRCISTLIVLPGPYRKTVDNG